MDLYKASLTGLVFAGVVAALAGTRLGADAVLIAGLAVLLVGGVLTPQEALGGFSNEGMLTVAALFVVAAGLRQTGAMTRLAGFLLGRSTGTHVALARLTAPVAALSALLNNTPIVAALAPAVIEWSRRNQVAASRFLMPLSFATILGGTITVIGTSTNLVVTGLIQKNLDRAKGLVEVGIFDITPIGLTVATVGLLYLVFATPRLLPDRRPAISREDDPRSYTSELLVQPGSVLVGKTIDEAGLRHLPGAFLAELDRAGMVLPAVEPTTRLAANDRLVFVGPRESILDLTRIPGLSSAADRVFQDTGVERCLVEAVVAPQNPIVGQTIRDGAFRTRYDAVVVAVARDGERVGGRIGDIELRVGDVLLLEADPSWVTQIRDRRDFYLASAIDDSASFRHHRAPIALVLLTGMVIAAATSATSMFLASIVAAAAMLVTGCVSGAEARRAMDWPTLVAIAAAFGIGEGIRVSGADALIAQAVVAAGGSNPWAALIAMYVATAILTELITNNAAAALMFPFGLSLAERLSVSPMPFCVAIMFAASASFATPIGYQTNLMVYGPGGYRFGDFFRLGLPLQVVAGITTLTLTPYFFPF